MTGVLEFCKKYREKLKNDKTIAKDEVGEPFVDYVQRISFFVAYTEFAPGIRVMGGNYLLATLKLDSEDLEYLYTKYHAKLQVERDERVAKLDKEYSSVIQD